MDGGLKEKRLEFAQDKQYPSNKMWHLLNLAFEQQSVTKVTEEKSLNIFDKLKKTVFANCRRYSSQYSLEILLYLLFIKSGTKHRLGYICHLSDT